MNLLKQTSEALIVNRQAPSNKADCYPFLMADIKFEINTPGDRCPFPTRKPRRALPLNPSLYAG